jgi:hypothetical protein
VKQPINRLLMMRARGLNGPVFQRVGVRTLARSAGNYVGTVGSGPIARFGLIVDETTVRITFTQCVAISGTTGFEYQIGTGAWTAVSAVAEADPPGDGTVWDFTTGSIPDLTEVRWRMAEGAATDCDEGEDVPAATLLIGNVLISGNFVVLQDLSGYVLTEDGDYILLEDA